MVEVEIKELLEAGVHFGHQRKNWNPKMKTYIYCDKNGTCIINLDKTSELLKKACDFIKEQVKQKKNIIFVGTKRNISELIKREAIRCGAYYINRRWLGGLLTNFDTIRHRLNRLRELEDMQSSGTLNRLNKKEQSTLNKELDKLQKTLGGIKNMRGKPEVIYVIDQQNEEIAVKEANAMNIKVIAIIDTNCNPDGIDYPIPGNDDSIRSVQLITSKLSDAIIEGHEGQVPDVHNINKPTINRDFTTSVKNLDEPVNLVQEIVVPLEQEVN
ncbi:MAG: 30S ribosomal protein S2 [Candidatus Melainabacteria bacterium]|nr:30S ribosomal protein S2 [Candidatus Melainabacteria bacterium]MBI3308612.1 30S ribosomal protein S2 [Candidatus Melainabacteria bacterium]